MNYPEGYNPPKLPENPPRILLMTSQYFLLGEVLAALNRLEVPCKLLDFGTKEMDLDTFVTTVRDTLNDFKPDFVLTVNHLGVDHEGVLAQLLDEADIPLASWFVDSPFLILDTYRNLTGCRTALFTWDVDTVAPLADFGFDTVHHLPLGCDATRFVPGDRSVPDEWLARVSFVGNSMKTKTERRFVAAQPSFSLVEASFDLAEEFVEAEERTARAFIARVRPDLSAELNAIEPGRKLAYETYITWLATCLYRRDCIARTMPFNPLLVGDKGWTELFKHVKGWRYHKELSYYDDLPSFYPVSEINFNCTSRQMKGAVNQRVFDVPCCGAFLLTDDRMGLEDLFEPGTEVIAYRTKDEIPELLERYLADPQARQRIADAGRRRVLAEHTYDHRMASLIEHMRATFG